MVKHRRAQPTDGMSVPQRHGGTIRGRLARILALPLVAVLVLLAVVAANEVGGYQTARATTGSVKLSLAVQDLVTELQLERGLNSGLLGGNESFRAEIEPERKVVEAQRVAVDRVAGEGAEGATAVRAALRQLDGLTAVRAQVDAGKAKRADNFQYYTDKIGVFNAVDFGLGRSTDRTLRDGVAALAALNDMQEQTSKERAFLNGVFSAGGFTGDEYVQFAGINAAQQVALAEFRANATAAQRARQDAVLNTGAASESAYFEQLANTAADRRLLQVNPQSWWSALTTVIGGTRKVQQAVGADIQTRATQLQRNATLRLSVLGGLVLLCMAGALALVIAAVRSITGPLAELAAEADSLASQRLPEAVARLQGESADDSQPPPDPVQVPARASSEIRSVAVALDRVQATAFALATEQAVLRRNTTESLANLGRRNQNLLRRQLGFITTLENEENDPSGLANLFELDHLATRMRRNAESLLVLVGESSPRPWSAPLPVADVIRAAISEVEEYRRVSMRRIDDAFIAGNYVTGLAHMVAELVENGLAFSPPDVDVEIQGRQLGGQYLIAIIDQGVGMGDEELARANARLRGEESFLLAPTRFLGHYVVGQLAQQMSADVQMAPSPVTGVTARVMLPASVLATPSAINPSEVRTPESGAAEAVRDEIPAPASAPIPAEIIGQTEIVSQPVGLSASVPSPRAIGVRPAPVVEYITLPGSEGPGAIGTGVFEPIAPVRMDRGTASGVASVGSAFGFDGARSGSAPAGASEMPPGTRFGAAGGGPGGTAGSGPGGSGPGNSTPGSGGAPERTANGLIKRPPRSRSGATSTGHATAVSASTDRTERPPVADESPDAMRSRLSALRAGVYRGETDRESGEGQPGGQLAGDGKYGTGEGDA
jgi:anti-sigma regulatory factor (Ser/Thr protein kinase)